MFKTKIISVLSTAYRMNRRSFVTKIRNITPVALGLLTSVQCEKKQVEPNISWDNDSLEHEFLIRQATTVNVNAATQLLTVTLVAIQDTSERYP